MRVVAKPRGGHQREGAPRGGHRAATSGGRSRCASTATDPGAKANRACPDRVVRHPDAGSSTSGRRKSWSQDPAGVPPDGPAPHAAKVDAAAVHDTRQALTPTDEGVTAAHTGAARTVSAGAKGVSAPRAAGWALRGECERRPIGGVSARFAGV